MTYEQKRVLDSIIRNYGIQHQIDIAIEECSELIKALLKLRRKPTKNAIWGVIDELADVEIMLNQMKIIFECQEIVENRIDYKIQRQIERMKNNE